MLISGKKIAKEVFAQIKQELEGEEAKPGLAVVLIGEDPASKIYVSRKHKRAMSLGYHQETHRLPEDTTQETLFALIDRLPRSSHFCSVFLCFLPRQLFFRSILFFHFHAPSF